MTSEVLPGLIDVHRHYRDLDQAEKETFTTGSASAIASGITLGGAMPNSEPKITSLENLLRYQKAADGHLWGDVFFIFGTTGENLSEFPKVWPLTKALKIYRNESTGSMAVTDSEVVKKIFKAWDCPQPIMTHSEGEKLVQEMTRFAGIYDRWVHFCHVSLAEEIAVIRVAKKEGFPISAEVCPHHLAFTVEDLSFLGNYGLMKPPLAKKEDQETLWEAVADGTIDMIATDHAPHTFEEKAGDKPAWGVISEPTLPIMWRLFSERELSLDLLVRLMHEAPAKIFSLPSDSGKVIFYPDPEYKISASTIESKAGFSPFVDSKAKGRVEKVYLHGELVYENEQFIGLPQGKVI